MKQTRTVFDQECPGNDSLAEMGEAAMCVPAKEIIEYLLGEGSDENNQRIEQLKGTNTVLQDLIQGHRIFIEEHEIKSYEQYELAENTIADRFMNSFTGALIETRNDILEAEATGRKAKDGFFNPSGTSVVRRASSRKYDPHTV